MTSISKFQSVHQKSIYCTLIGSIKKQEMLGSVGQHVTHTWYRVSCFDSPHENAWDGPWDGADESKCLLVLSYLTRSITLSLGAELTGSSLIMMISSPGMSLPSDGPPVHTHAKHVRYNYILLRIRHYPPPTHQHHFQCQHLWACSSSLVKIDESFK